MSALINTTPELRLWLTHAERHGAIHDADGSGGFVVVLPAEVQRSFGLPEEMAITASPEAAREDGLLLLCAGHPLVDAVAHSVLDAGDAGERWLVWPSQLPRTVELLDLARSFLPVDHGRVDLGGEPGAIYAPLVRVGALVTYTIDERFQEREEVWVDGRTGLPVGRVDETLYAPRQMSRHPLADVDLVRALDGAEALLTARTDRRLRDLRATADPVREQESARAETYYRGQLDSLRQRRTIAPPDRHKLLDARLEATARERDRRLHEIADKFRGEHSRRPFRLHVVHCPAIDLPLVVRRGERTWPLTLTWLLHAASFVATRCPACGHDDPLVAGRSQLGCRSCLPRPASTVEAQVEVRGRAVMPSPAPSPAAIRPSVAPPPAPQPQPPSVITRTRRGRDGRGEAKPILSDEIEHRRERDLDDLRAQHLRRAARLTKAGNRLAFELWQACANRERWPRQRVMPDSPFAAMQRLFGMLSPQVAVGMPVSARPESSTSATGPGRRTFEAAATGGAVRAGGIEYTYVLRWQWLDNQALVWELLPGHDESGWIPTVAGSLPPKVAAALLWNAPQPIVELDPVEATLWRNDLARVGLPAVVRCITLWSQLRPELDAVPPEVAAAALAIVVARTSQLPRTVPHVSLLYGASPAEVRPLVKRLRKTIGVGSF